MNGVIESKVKGRLRVDRITIETNAEQPDYREERYRDNGHFVWSNGKKAWILQNLMSVEVRVGGIRIPFKTEWVAAGYEVLLVEDGGTYRFYAAASQLRDAMTFAHQYVGLNKPTDDEVETALSRYWS